MLNRTALILSSLVAGSLLTLTAAPAMAGAVDPARDLVVNITPANNVRGSRCGIDFYSSTATSNGACFLLS